MIQIIKSPIANEPREITCPNPKCRAGLSYLDSDVKHSYSIPGDPVIRDRHFIICPCCGRTINVEWR